MDGPVRGLDPDPISCGLIQAHPLVDILQMVKSNHQ